MVSKRQLDRIKQQLQPDNDEDFNVNVYLYDPETGITKGNGKEYTEEEFEEHANEHDVRLVRGNCNGI